MKHQRNNTAPFYSIPQPKAILPTSFIFHCKGQGIQLYVPPPPNENSDNELSTMRHVMEKSFAPRRVRQRTVFDRAFNYTWTPLNENSDNKLSTIRHVIPEIVCTEECPAAHGIVTSRYVFPAQTAKRDQNPINCNCASPALTPCQRGSCSIECEAWISGNS
ncbi:hypothetical protein CEXT_706211 [Caerostris extrusa]|uniref:Uncharacterized protein n=1 Tax=Caerostris extrusa TaxID=172846 RepID=A0AAV4XEC8_CAEEX|nr:hypothetical protein CEXT_706211 [Caerostris extrusa]